MRLLEVRQQVLCWWRAEGEISGVLCVRFAVTFSHIPIAYMVAGVSHFFVQNLDCAARLLSVAYFRTVFLVHRMTG
jgi:hypothetical protein